MDINQVEVTRDFPEVTMTGSDTQGAVTHPRRYATKRGAEYENNDV
jgi:hypothetical protein